MFSLIYFVLACLYLSSLYHKLPPLSLSAQTVRISSPSHYQGVGEAGGTQVDIQSEEKSSSDCMTIYKFDRKLPDHVTLLGTWYGL